MDNGYTPLPREVQITNQHSLRTDGQVRKEEWEEEVLGDETKSQAHKVTVSVNMHRKTDGCSKFEFYLLKLCECKSGMTEEITECSKYKLSA